MEKNTFQKQVSISTRTTAKLARHGLTLDFDWKKTIPDTTNHSALSLSLTWEELGGHPRTPSSHNSLKLCLSSPTANVQAHAPGPLTGNHQNVVHTHHIKTATTATATEPATASTTKTTTTTTTTATATTATATAATAATAATTATTRTVIQSGEAPFQQARSFQPTLGS